MRVLKWTAAATGMLIVLTLIAVTVTIHSPTGSRWVVEYLIPGGNQSRMTNLSGTLSSGMSADTIILQPDQNTRITIQQLKTQWRIEWLKRHLFISQAKAKRILVETADKPQKQADRTRIVTPNVKLPFSIDAQEVVLGEFLTTPDGPPILQDLLSRFKWHSEQLAFSELSVSTRDIRIALQGDLQTVSPHTLEIYIQAAQPSQQLELNTTITGAADQYKIVLGGTANSDKYPPADINLNGTGNLDGINIDTIDVNSPAGQIDASVRADWFPVLALSGDFNATNIQVNSLAPSTQGQISATGQFAIENGLIDLSSNLSGSINHLPISANLAGRGKIDRFEIQDSWIDVKQNRLHITGFASQNDRLLASLKFRANDLDPSAVSENISGNLGLIGMAEIDNGNYQAQLSLNGTLSDNPLTVDLDIAGNPESLRIEKGKISSNNSSVDLAGTMAFSPLIGSFSINSKDFDPSQFFPEYPARLDTVGSFEFKQNYLTTKLEINGVFRNAPLTANLNAQGDFEKLHFENTNINSGANRIDVSGSLSRQGADNFRWAVTTPDLSTLWPDAKGSIKGTGLVTGAWKDPVGKGNLRIQEVQLGKYSVNQGNIEFNSTEADDLALTISASNIDMPALSLKSVEIKGAGTQEYGELTLQLKTLHDDLFQSNINVTRNSDNWGMLIHDSVLTGPTWEALKQAEPTNASLSEQSLVLDEFCLQGPIELICVSADKNSAYNATFTNVPLKRLRFLTSKADQLTENLNGKLQLQEHDGFWKLDSELALDDTNQLTMNATITPVSGALEGKLDLEFHKLDWLILLTDELANPQGKLQGKFTLAGTLQNPEVNGQLTLDESSVQIPVLGLDLQKMVINAQSRPGRLLSIDGVATSGQGQLTLKGQVNMVPRDQWQATLKIAGSNALVSDLPEARVVATPELNIIASTKRLDIQGDLTIPEALIRLAQLPENAITISPDARIVNDNETDVSHTSSTSLQANINLNIGPDVKLEGKGLNASLSGKLKLNQQPGKETTATGTIDIIEGSYTAYGQNLTMNHGSLIFNGPASDPGLNLQAERRIKEQIVGLNIGGSLNNIESNLFSIPSINQSDAIAYLITGKPLGGSSGENTMITNALVGLGIKGSSSIISDIRDSTGLNTFELDAGENTTETALLIGKYLTPELYIQYVKRLFSENDSVQLRYELTENLELEAESGTHQGINLNYRIEK